MKSARTLNTLDRFVLASFILCPLHHLEKGRRPADIRRTAPFAFRKVTHFDNPATCGTIVAMSCRWLQQRGYLDQVGTVKAVFTVPYRYREPEQIEYDSPLFRPTETGLLFALSYVDPAELPMLVRGKKPKKKQGHKRLREFQYRYGYDPTDYDVCRSFARSIGSDL